VVEADWSRLARYRNTVDAAYRRMNGRCSWRFPYLFFWRASEEAEEFRQVTPAIADSIFQPPS
jgi:hypothetical protein